MCPCALSFGRFCYVEGKRSMCHFIFEIFSRDRLLQVELYIFVAHTWTVQISPTSWVFPKIQNKV